MDDSKYNKEYYLLPSLIVLLNDVISLNLSTFIDDSSNK